MSGYLLSFIYLNFFSFFLFYFFIFILLSLKEIPVFNANSGEPDQTQRSAASYLGLHWFAKVPYITKTCLFKYTENFTT